MLLLEFATIRADNGYFKFSVPEDVRREFNALFENENKSAILTQLMRQAIEGGSSDGVFITADEKYFRKTESAGGIQLLKYWW